MPSSTPGFLSWFACRYEKLQKEKEDTTPIATFATRPKSRKKGGKGKKK